MVVDVLLTYKTGLSRYFGMLDLAIKYNIFQSVSTRIVLPDGSKTFSKTINGNPTKYFTEDILNHINKHVYNDFMYGATEHDVDDTHVEECND